MTRRTAWATTLFLTTGLTAACGGGSPPPKTADAADPPLDATSAPPSAAPSTSAPASSPDVTKGEAALQSNDLAGAKSSFRAALTKNPKDATAHYYLGVVAEKENDKATATTEYQAALASNPALENASLNLAAIDVDAGQFDAAIAVARAGIGKNPTSTALHENLAIALANKGDAAGADAEFQTATSSSNDPGLALAYANWLGAWKRIDDAVARLRIARANAKGDAGLLADIGHSLHKAGAFPDCVGAYDDAIAIKDAPDLRTERAACKLGARDAPGAKDDLTAAVAMDPKFPLARYYLGSWYFGAKDWKAASASYDAYLKLAPDGPYAKQAADRSKLARSKSR